MPARPFRRRFAVVAVVAALAAAPLGVAAAAARPPGKAPPAVTTPAEVVASLTTAGAIVGRAAVVLGREAAAPLLLHPLSSRFSGAPSPS